MEVVEELRRYADKFAATDVHTIGDSELSAALVTLHETQSVIAAGIARVTAAFDLRRIWAADGAKSAAPWLAHRCHASLTAMRCQVRTAKRLRSMPHTRQAFATGRIGDDHVQVLARLAGSPRSHVAAQFALDEEMLVGFALDLRFDDFERAIKYWLQHVDADGIEDDAADDHDARFFHADETIRGNVSLSGMLDPVGGAAFTEALRRIESELFKTDWAAAKAEHGDQVRIEHLARTGAQRRADALVEMAHRAHAAPAGARLPAPLISVLVGYETFAGRICQLANGTVVTPGQVASLLTEADIERVVFSGKSRVIDVGERTRFFTGATRRAVEVTHQRCVHPTCDTPADQCDIDHSDIDYVDGGPTTQDNGKPLCGYHHRHKTGAPP